MDSTQMTHNIEIKQKDLHILADRLIEQAIQYAVNPTAARAELYVKARQNFISTLDYCIPGELERVRQDDVLRQHKLLNEAWADRWDEVERNHDV